MGRDGAGARERKRHGRHYTPATLAGFLAGRVAARIDSAGPVRVLDPACGSGELLFAIRDALADRLPGAPVELVGYDLDPAGLALARRRAAGSGVEAEWRQSDFLADCAGLPDESFDAVIANPPYVRTQQLGGAAAQALRGQFGLQGRIDLTHPFVAALPRLMMPGGVLGLLCANRFLTTKAGANLRALLLTDLTPVELYDLGDTKLFEAAVLPAVTIAVRGAARGECRYVSVYEEEGGIAPAPGSAGTETAEPESARVKDGGLDAAGSDDAAPEDARSDGAGLGAAGSAGADLEAADLEAADLEAAAPAGAVSEAAGVDGADPEGAGSGGAGEKGAVRAVLSPRRGGPLEGDPPDPAPRWRGAESAAGGGADTRAGKRVRGPDSVSGAANEERELFAALDGAGDATVWRQGRRFAVTVGELATESGAAAATMGWRMSRAGHDDWLRGVAARMWRTFGDLGRIRVGIKTNADKVFIAAHWGDPAAEPELLRDLITHHDLRPWRIDRTRRTRVLYPYDLTRTHRVPVDLTRYPRTAAYLEQHREALAARGYLTGAGREWFEHWVPQRPHLWRTPKVVFPDISDRPRFALDRSGAVVNGDCYWISLADLGGDAGAEDMACLMMGIANSSLGLRYYDAVCGNRLYSGRRRWITQYVSRLPLPHPGTPAALAIVHRVRELAAEPESGPVGQAELNELVDRAFA
ncbi:Eco57I restriction-modification methylase domain-containing protein [Nocardia grenadensis]|uniref:Eco57I restriction-modification methylase domain-containing protein n=1 Tax=Nocardia grenadensis TaxID=931537 RepID=UPI0007A4F0AC|nr:N-6 DNA methylase [Nocardia grenadensis]